MKKILLILSIILSTSAFASQYQLGVMLGEPTGISGKYQLGNNRSIDGLLAYSLGDDLGLVIHADYLFEKARSFNIGEFGPLDLYYGIGGRIVDLKHGKHKDELAIGPRAPIGLSYDLVNPNLQFFAELAVAFDLVPATEFDLQGGLGVRIRF